VVTFVDHRDGLMCSHAVVLNVPEVGGDEPGAVRLEDVVGFRPGERAPAPTITIMRLVRFT